MSETVSCIFDTAAAHADAWAGVVEILRLDGRGLAVASLLRHWEQT